MDPLSCVAITCAVMQVLTFSNELVVLYRKIKKGSIDTGAEAKSDLIATNARLIQENLAKASGMPLTEDDTVLQDVAKRCLGCSKALADVVNSIKWKSVAGRMQERSPFGQAWEARRYKSEVEKLETDLKDVQEIMKGTILVSSWLSGKAAAAEQLRGFDELNSQLQQFIVSQADSYRQQISTKITEEAAEAQKRIAAKIIEGTASVRKEMRAQAGMLNNQLAGQVKRQVDRDMRHSFLGSLRFPTMRERKSRITKAHGTTFGWIFGTNISGPWDSFSAWLESEDQVYWISGKPGSGKSTLMKYLVDQETTKEILREWDPSVAIISFFLWSSGSSKLQKSIQGLLCALLSQILELDEELAGTLLAGDAGLLEKRTYHDWSDEELEAVLTTAIMRSKRRVVMFLDGLDEIDRNEGPFPVIQLIRTLEARTHAKFCLSSRPEAELQDAFGKGWTLRLEDLTRNDIRVYVEYYFQKDLTFWVGGTAEPQSRRKQIIDEILERASGVFLWVFLVIRSLRSGTSNIDSYDQLLRRVRQLPSTVEQLYKEAWDRLGDNEELYRDEAASYFQLVLQSQHIMDTLTDSCRLMDIPFSLLEYLLAHNGHLRAGFLESRSIPPAKILISKTREIQRRVETCSGGLLEIFRSVESSPKDYSYDWIKSGIENFLNQFLMPFSIFLDLEKEAQVL